MQNDDMAGRIMAHAFNDELEKIAGIRKGLGEVWEGVVNKAVGDKGGKRQSVLRNVLAGGPTRRAVSGRVWKATPSDFQSGFVEALTNRRTPAFPGRHTKRRSGSPSSLLVDPDAYSRRRLRRMGKKDRMGKKYRMGKK